MKKVSKKLLLAFISVIVFGVVVAIAFSYGYTLGAKNPKEIVVKNITNTESESVKADFGVFWQVWDKLRNEHVDGTTTPDRDMVYGSIRGLINSFKDPNTVFLEPSDSQRFEEDISGSFGGIGAELNIKDNVVTIVAPLKNTPAEHAGLKSGDKILKVNGTSTLDLDLNQVVKLIRGQPGTKVVLTILREGWKEAKDIEMVRDIIEVPTLDVNMAGAAKDIAHFQLYSFNANASKVFYDGVIKALLGGARGIILDLRNNPGGFLEEAVNLAGWFLKRGELVVSEQFRSGEKQNFYAYGPATLVRMPVIILVNGGSASASEILAGALRDHRQIKLVGEKTFGKGTVQELQPLKDGSTLKITIAKWVMPSGNIIEKQGLAPDIEVKISEEDQKQNKDPQLEKAIEVLQSEIK